MTDTGQIDEDLYSLRETKKYIGDIYNRRIHEKGGVHESDGYADALGSVLDSLDRAAKERESEKQSAGISADATPAEWWAARSNNVTFAESSAPTEWVPIKWVW